MQHEDPVLSPIIQKIDQNDVSPQVSNYFINGEGLCHLSKRPSRSPRSNTTRKQVCIPHCLKARILESVHSEYGGHLKFFKTYHRLSENFFWQNMYKDTKNFVRSCTICLSRKNAFKIPPAPHQPVEQSQEPGETCHIDIFGPLKTTPIEHGRDIQLSYTYEKNSDTPQNKYEYVEKLLPSLEQIFNKVLNNLKDQEASHVDLSTRATKQHHYDYKIGSLCFIKTPNIKSNLSPKLRPKFEGPYRCPGWNPGTPNAQRTSNPEFRVGSNFRVIPEQYFSGVENVSEFLENIDNSLTYYEIPTQLACAYLKGHLKGRALDWFGVLGYRVVEDKVTDYAHLKQALTDVVRNRSKLEIRFYASYQNCNQRPSDFVYELLKIH
ncbi:integrase catalytic domain-containing protein [Trichonephila clavipes]|nr:integrase catalytic domain-containing protein [Trichonephila clavipes]